MMTDQKGAPSIGTMTDLAAGIASLKASEVPVEAGDPNPAGEVHEGVCAFSSSSDSSIGAEG